MTQEQIKGKFIIAYDTLCDGWQCAMVDGYDDKGNPIPLLFDSEDEAFMNIFTDAYCMLSSDSNENLEEEGLNRSLIEEMDSIIDSDDIKKARELFFEHPNLNYSEEWVEPAETFIMNRKAFFTSEGIVVEGKPLF